MNHALPAMAGEPAHCAEQERPARIWRSALLACFSLVLAAWCQPVVADELPSLAAASVSAGLGFTPIVPSGIALTGDGRYAYLAFEISASVVKVRLSDMSIVAGADFARYFPMRCSRIVLDTSETKLFLLDHTLGRLLVLDAVTLQEIRMINGLPPASRRWFAPAGGQT